jgi:hypothetical protein
MSRPLISRALLAGLGYFAVVFGTGAVLGTLRVLWLAPAVGARTAELLELPVVIAVAAATARWIVRRMALATGERLAMGISAFLLVLACEFTVVLAARGLTLERYFTSLDPVSGSAYYLALMLFMVLPVCFEPREEVPA